MTDYPKSPEPFIVASASIVHARDYARRLGHNPDRIVFLGGAADLYKIHGLHGGRYHRVSPLPESWHEIEPRLQAYGLEEAG